MAKEPTRARQLANSLRQSIEKGDYISGQALASERELTESTGFSRTTVRRAIQILVEQGILQTVQGSGTFVRQALTNSTAARILGLIVPSINNPYYGELTYAIEREATARGYQLLVGQFRYSTNSEADYLLRYAENESVKGILVVPDPDQPPVDSYNYLAQMSKPLVFVSRVIGGVQADSVIPDRVAGAYELVNYLINLGHRNIAYIRGIPPIFDSQKLGYERALREAGLPISEDLIVSLNSPGDEAGEKGVDVLFQRQVRFTAIFARNDNTAVGVNRKLRQLGLRVPEEISIAGFDNTEISAQLQPALTTVDTAVQEVGRLALSLLLDRIEGRYRGLIRQLVIRSSLIVRFSCGQATLEPIALDQLPKNKIPSF
jgi:DNA-binding LacI/PurR family transcriptional regulator